MSDKYRARILLVEDDVNLGFLVKDYLEMQEYVVDLQEDGVKGFEAFARNSNNIDLCILDVMMPFKDGFTLADEIRKINMEVPIIFLTAKSMKEDKIKGFKIGADDYITKPFSSEVLILRIEAVLRRYRYSANNGEGQHVFDLASFKFDYANQLLIRNEQERSLTKREAEVLRLLCLNQNKLLRRDIALKTIWGEDDYFKGRSMDVYITKLRKYLKEDATIAITNVHGTGFKLEINDGTEEK